MPRTLYVHVGPEKTGTSAIQHILRHHDDSVLIYPKVGLWGDGSHHTLVLKFFGEYRREKATDSDVSALFDAIASLTQSSGLDVLISSELLSLRQDVGEFIEELGRRTGISRANTEILLTCREHFDRAASRYSQRLRRADERDPDQFLRQSVSELCYAPMIHEMEKTGCKVMALNYHPAHDSVRNFLKYVGFSDNQIPQPEQKNVSLSTKALIAKLAANRVLQERFDKREGSLKFLRKMQAFKGASQFIFGRDASAEAEGKFSIDRKFLDTEFNISFPVPDLENQENMFFLSADEFSDISRVVLEMGADGEKIVEIARAFVRT